MSTNSGERNWASSSTDQEASRSITESFRLHGYSDENFEDGLRTFIGKLRAAGGPKEVGLVYRDEGYTRPFLNIYLLWPTQISEQMAASTEALATRSAVDEFAQRVRANLDVIVDYVDPASIQTSSNFGDAVSSWAGIKSRNPSPWFEINLSV